MPTKLADGLGLRDVLLWEVMGNELSIMLTILYLKLLIPNLPRDMPQNLVPPFQSLNCI
jgi:hypothetical protein